MRARGWGLVGVLVIAAARLAIPTAPAMYEGPIGPTEPFHYCDPPANLASTNKQPGAGAGDLLAAGEVNQLGSHSTTDNQVLTFFPKGSLKAPGATRYHVAITPRCSGAPAPPPGNKVVGDPYELTVVAQPGDLAVSFVPPPQVQVLVRTPPLQYTSVQVFYDSTWHRTQWGQQGDIANVTLGHPGVVAALDDGSANAAGKPPDKRSPGIVTVIEVVLLAAAVGIVVAAIIVQKRRAVEDPGAPAAAPTPAAVPKGTRAKGSRKSR
jgi:hypothetical protein